MSEKSLEEQMKEVLDRIGTRLDNMEQQIEEKETQEKVIEKPSAIDKMKAYAFPTLVIIISFFQVRMINSQDKSVEMINQLNVQMATMQAQLGFVMAKSKLDEGINHNQKKTLTIPLTYLDAIHSNEIEITNFSPQNITT